MLDRREFLRRLGVLTATVAVLPSLLSRQAPPRLVVDPVSERRVPVTMRYLRGSYGGIYGTDSPGMAPTLVYEQSNDLVHWVRVIA